jgi:hypothetical protein
MLYYARDLERTEPRLTVQMLDELDRTNMVRFKGYHWSNIIEKENSGCSDFFLALAIQAGLQVYVKEKLDANITLIRQKEGRPLLDYALRPRRLSPILSHLGQKNIVDPQIVRLLLEHGSDPNEQIEHYALGSVDTVWDLFITNCSNPYTGHPSDQVSTREINARYEVIELLIDFGAYPINVSVLQDTLISILGEDKAAQLISRLREVAQRKRSQTSVFWRLLGW